MTTSTDTGMTRGLHVTGIPADVGRADFHAGSLVLGLVKRTCSYADAERLPLIYGGGLGNPGSLLTFLVWQATGRGRTGFGQAGPFLSKRCYLSPKHFMVSAE